MRRPRTLGAALCAATLLLLGPTDAHAAPPAGYAVTGIDVSAYQGTIDWTAVAAGGAKFAYIRASEQAGIPDATFATNYAAAKASGLYAGAYHRARPDVSGGREQADYLVDHAAFAEDGRTLPPMLDIEWPRSNWTGLDACYNLTPDQLVAWIRAFVDEVQARTGRLPMLYTNPNWWNPCTARNTTFGNLPLFNSGYVAAPPAPPAGWSTWTLWQYSDSGSLPGDQDVFNGDLAALARLAGGTPFALRSHANGRYVTAESGGAAPLIAGRAAIGPWELFDRIDAGDGWTALRSHANGRLVTAAAGGSAPLIADRLVIGAWERFRLTVGADGSVSLLSFANGRYVAAANAGAAPLVADRTAVGEWERFDMMPVAAPIALRASNGRYVVAEAGGGAPLVADRTAIGAWERFEHLDAGGGYVALRAAVNGRYVTAEQGGAAPLIADRPAVGAWERFRVVVGADGSVSLLALADGRYVTAPADGSPLMADGVTIGPAQTFRRIVL